MPLNGNSDVTKEFQDTFKIQTVEGTLLNIGTSVNPVYNVTPKYSPITFNQVNVTTTGDAVITTLDSKRKFAITYISLNLTKNSTADNISTYVTGVVQNQTVRLIQLITQNTVANQSNVAIAFSFPLIVDAGSALTLVGTFSVGTMTKSVIISGFYI